jgi:hypothetical protein
MGARKQGAETQRSQPSETEGAPSPTSRVSLVPPRRRRFPLIVVPPDRPSRRSWSPGLSTAPCWSPQDKLWRKTLPYRPWSLTLPYKPLRLTLLTVYTLNQDPKPWRGDHAQLPWTVRGTTYSVTVLVWEFYG